MMDTTELKKLAEAALQPEVRPMGRSLKMASFYSLATPAAVLELIAKIDRLHCQVNAECDDWAREVERRMTAEVEVERLKAELECARGDFQTLERIAEKSGKDAERYRWLRDSARSGGCLSDMSFGDLVDAYCDERIDQAMSKESTHDQA